MNAYVGPQDANGTPISPSWQQFLKTSNFRNPATIFVTLDEHPDSINDGWYIISGDPAQKWQWGDLPASYHNGACGFSFADGHAEIKKWLSPDTKRPVLQKGSGFPVSIATDKRDIVWINERTSVRK